ncbi:MAG: AsmA family protein [Myxococcota bacterium]
MIRRLAIAAGVLLVAGAFLFDGLVGSAIERSATRTFGVETRVGFARMRPVAGELRLRRARVANPPGFESPWFLRVDRTDVEARLLDLRHRKVEIPLVELDGVEVSLERDGKRTNYGAILQNMGRFEGGGPAREASSKQFVVRRLLIRNVQAHVEWNAVAARQTSLELTIPEIELRDLGEGGGLTTSELANLVTKAILGSIARSGGSLPGALVSGLNAGLRELGGAPDVIVRGVGKSLGDQVGELGRKAADALGGLLRGGDDE